MATTRAKLRGGIDLGGTKIQAIVVDSRHQVKGQSRHPTPTTGGPENVVAAMERALREAAEQAGLDAAELVGVGVGSPGTIDEQTGVVSQARNLPNWEGSYPVGEELGRRLGVPVKLGNDVGTAVAGEYKLGAGKPYKSLLGVFWGTGVGGGIILDGKPWHGRGAAAEIGHMVVKVDGARCTCGRDGCMEAYAGRAAMEIRARKLYNQGRQTKLFDIMEHKGRTRLTSGIWARALARNDELAIELVDRAVAALGAGIASAVNLLDIEAVIIGGGLGVRMGNDYVERIGEAMKPHLFNDHRPPALHLAGLGDLGGALGAALLAQPPARRRTPREPAARRAPAAAPTAAAAAV